MSKTIHLRRRESILVEVAEKWRHRRLKMLEYGAKNNIGKMGKAGRVPTEGWVAF